MEDTSEATLIAGLAGIVGLILGRFWDSRSETARWRRDQRTRTYEQIGASYYTFREAIRTPAMLEPGSPDADRAASRALDLSGELTRTIVAVCCMARHRWPPQHERSTAK